MKGGNSVEHVQMPRIDNQKTELLTEYVREAVLEYLDEWEEAQALIAMTMLRVTRKMTDD